MQEFSNLIEFIKEMERLKDITRTAWTSHGRQESVAEHSWRLCILSLAIEEYFPDLDWGKVIRMALIHDIGEAYEGDVSAKIAVDPEEKLKREENAVLKLTQTLGEELRQCILSIWWEYNQAQTQEAKLIKALDKIETIIQHNQGANPSDFDYEFNLAYGKKQADFHPIIQSIRELIDQETKNKMKS